MDGYRAGGAGVKSKRGALYACSMDDVKEQSGPELCVDHEGDTVIMTGQRDSRKLRPEKRVLSRGAVPTTVAAID